MKRGFEALVVIKSTDPIQIAKAVTSYVKKIKKEHPEVQKVIWFGSWVNGLPTPGSDVDICLIISSSDRPMRERVSDYLPRGFPVGIELFPYTVDEFKKLSHKSPTFYQAIVSGKDL